MRKHLQYASYIARVNEARLVCLERELDHAASCIEFLYECIRNPDDIFALAYPETVDSQLAAIRALVPERPYCLHSRAEEGCEACAQRVKRHERYVEACRVLRGDESP